MVVGAKVVMGAKVIMGADKCTLVTGSIVDARAFNTAWGSRLE